MHGHAMGGAAGARCSEVQEQEGASSPRTESVVSDSDSMLPNSKGQVVIEVGGVDKESSMDNSLSDGTDSEQLEAKATCWQHLKNPRVWGIITAVLLFLAAGLFFGTQIFEAIIAAKHWYLENKLISIPWYCFIFSIGSALLMPYGPFCISIGYIFGVGGGLPVQCAAIFVSSAFIYLVGRVLLKKRVDSYMSKYRLWRSIIDHMGRDWREAAKINILMCFIPMPYGTHAYLFSLSDCTFLNFVSFFELGMIGHTLLNLTIGEALSMASNQEGVNTTKLIASVFGVVAMVFAIWYGGIITQKIVDNTYDEEKMEQKAREKDTKSLLKNASVTPDHSYSGYPDEKDSICDSARPSMQLRRPSQDESPEAPAAGAGVGLFGGQRPSDRLRVDLNSVTLRSAEKKKERLETHSSESMQELPLGEPTGYRGGDLEPAVLEAVIGDSSTVSSLR
mmetsp:Transcript_44412/g.69434  ORF Transcript_44412/g.69434 Transcript_44412/m.69434 type:complete len:449 (+) Transcript_44412:555-1901(+)